MADEHKTGGSVFLLVMLLASTILISVLLCGIGAWFFFGFDAVDDAYSHSTYIQLGPLEIPLTRD